MNFADVQRILRDEGVRENAFLFDPPVLAEGILNVTRRSDGLWIAVQNERGESLVDERFESEDAAARFVLRKVLSDPTWREGFVQADLFTFWEERAALLAKYGLDEGPRRR